MKVFVWEELDNVSPSYHSEGGLLVVAESLSAAIVLAESKDFVVVGNSSVLWPSCCSTWVGFGSSNFCWYRSIT